MCGTAEWEWAEDEYAYMPSVHVCRGCALKDAAREDANKVSGGTIVLLSGAAKREALAKQREQYLASRRRRSE